MRHIKEIKALIQKDYINKTKKFAAMSPCQKVLVGDSMVAYFKTPSTWCNQGIAGDTTEGVLNRISLVNQLNPEIVVVHVGTNDLVLTELSLQDTLKNLKRITQQITANTCYICTPCPVDENAMDSNNVLRTNAKLKQLSAMIHDAFPNHMVIDLFSVFESNNQLPQKFHTGDGLHLNEVGYEIYYRILNSYMDGDK